MNALYDQFRQLLEITPMDVWLPLLMALLSR